MQTGNSEERPERRIAKAAALGGVAGALLRAETLKKSAIGGLAGAAIAGGAQAIAERSASRSGDDAAGRINAATARAVPIGAATLAAIGAITKTPLWRRAGVKMPSVGGGIADGMMGLKSPAIIRSSGIGTAITPLTGAGKSIVVSGVGNAAKSGREIAVYAAPGATNTARRANTVSPGEVVSGAVANSSIGRLTGAASSLLASKDTGAIGQLARDAQNRAALGATGRRDYINKVRARHAEQARRVREESASAMSPHAPEWGSLEHIPSPARERLLHKLRHIQKLRIDSSSAGERKAAEEAMARVKKTYGLSTISTQPRQILEGIFELGAAAGAKKAWRGFWHGESAKIPSWADAAIETVSRYPAAKLVGVDAGKLRDRATKMAQDNAASLNRKLLGWSVVPPAIQYGISKRDSNKSERNIINAVKQGQRRDFRSELDGIITFSGAWTRKEGKSRSGGLNEKGRKSYERENPGSDLKAPSKEAGNPRRASFCARMKGMKKKLTSSKTASDPDSRINKSLRAWNCSAREALDSIIAFADPRPRNSLGMFSGADGSGIDPEAIGAVYKQGAQVAQQEESALAGIARKLKGKKIRMSARESLDEIRFARGERAIRQIWPVTEHEKMAMFNKVPVFAKSRKMLADRLRAELPDLRKAMAYQKDELRATGYTGKFHWGAREALDSIINFAHPDALLSREEYAQKMQERYPYGKAIRMNPKTGKRYSEAMTKEERDRIESWKSSKTNGVDILARVRKMRAESDGRQELAARARLSEIINFARGDFLLKTMKKVGVSSPRAELGAIWAAGRGVQGTFNQAVTAAGRADLAGANTIGKVRSHLAGQLNEARKVTRNAPFKKPVAERPIAPDSGTAPDPRLKTAASYGNTPVGQAGSSVQPVNHAPYQQPVAKQPVAQEAVAQQAAQKQAEEMVGGAVKQPTAMSGPDLKYRLRGWRGASLAGAAGLGAGYALGGGSSNV